TVPVNNTTTILDIGAGTGLLSLMLAQRSSAVIDAVEMDADAAEQARVNSAISPWADRIIVHETSIQEFFKYTPTKYDLIICNPPFFSDSVKSGNLSKDMALHQTHLPVQELMQVTDFMLTKEGDAYFLISIYEEERFINAAKEAGLNCSRSMSMYDNADKLIRYVLRVSKKEITTVKEQKFLIRDKEGSYSLDFITALNDFYLHL
ncbi:MAG: methyltransferase, partial [Cytophagales bacterium]|nr:methyltransferase [Cytophaga sp.]